MDGYKRAIGGLAAVSTFCLRVLGSKAIKFLLLAGHLSTTVTAFRSVGTYAPRDQYSYHLSFLKTLIFLCSSGSILPSLPSVWNFNITGHVKILCSSNQRPRVYLA